MAICPYDCGTDCRRGGECLCKPEPGGAVSDLAIPIVLVWFGMNVLPSYRTSMVFLIRSSLALMFLGIAQATDGVAQMVLTFVAKAGGFLALFGLIGDYEARFLKMVLGDENEPR